MGLIRRKSVLVSSDKVGVKTNQIFLARFLPSNGSNKEIITNIDGSDEEEDEVRDSKKNILLLELPVDYQIYNMIESNGPAGVYQKDVSFSNFSYRDTIKRIESISKRGLVTSYPENVGRTVTHKLVARFLQDGSRIDQTDIEKELLILNETLYQESKGDKPDNKITEKTMLTDEIGVRPELKPIRKAPKKTIQFVRRKRLLLDELESGRIIPMSEIKRIFEQDQYNERSVYIESLNDDLRNVVNTESLKKQYVIDKKTINSVVEDILKDGVAKKTTAMIPMSNGTTKSVQFLLSTNLAQETVSEYISSLRDEDITNKGTYLPNKKLKDLELIDDKNHVIMSVDEPNNRDTGYTISIRYGFVKARMQRVKMFHNYLNSYVIKHIEAEEYPFDLTDSVMNMEVALYCQVIGQVMHVEGLEQYKTTKVINLPPHIQSKVLQRRIFMRRVQTLLDMLLKLQLVSKIISMEMAEDAQLEGNRCDYILKKNIKISENGSKEYNIDSALSDYWKDLESFCHQKIISEDEEFINSSDIPRECFSKSSWSGFSQLSRHQKRVLNNSINTLKGENPGPYADEPIPLMSEISKETRLSPHQVLMWYNNTLKPVKEKKKKKTPFDQTPPKKRLKTDEEPVGRALPNRKSSRIGKNVMDQTSPEEKHTVELPSDLDSFYKTYRVKNDPPAVIAYPSSHLSSATALSNYDETPPTTHNLILGDYIVSILMIPEREYRIESAYELFGKFYEHELTECFDHLRRSGSITKDKSGSRGYQLSRKFKGIIKHFSKETLREMKDFSYSTIGNSNFNLKEYIFPPIINHGGSVAVLLTELIKNNLKMYIETPEKRIHIQKLDRQRILGRNDEKKLDQDRLVPDSLLPLASVKLSLQVEPKHFLETLKPSTPESESQLFPWVNIDGTVNETLLNDIKLIIASIIHNKPGLTVRQIVKEWCIFRPEAMLKVIQLLEKEEFLHIEQRKFLKPCFGNIEKIESLEFTLPDADDIIDTGLVEEKFLIPSIDIQERMCRLIR